MSVVDSHIFKARDKKTGAFASKVWSKSGAAKSALRHRGAGDWEVVAFKIEEVSLEDYEVALKAEKSALAKKTRLEKANIRKLTQIEKPKIDHKERAGFLRDLKKA